MRSPHCPQNSLRPQTWYLKTDLGELLVIQRSAAALPRRDQEEGAEEDQSARRGRRGRGEEEEEVRLRAFSGVDGMEERSPSLYSIHI